MADFEGAQRLELLTILEPERRETASSPYVPEVTVYDRIVGYLRAGSSVPEAAAAVGVDRATIRGWMAAGAAAEKKRAAGGTRVLSKKERLLAAFSLACAQATAQHEVRLTGVATRLATGEGLVNEVTTVKVARNDAGEEVEVERLVKRNNVLPSADMTKFLLTHRHHERWATPDKLEVTGAGGGPVQVTSGEGLEALLDSVAARIEKRTAAMAAITGHTPEPGQDDDTVDAVVVDDLGDDDETPFG